MELRDKVMRKANLTGCLIAFCLASLAMPLIAQQVPVTPDAVRKELNQPAPAKSAAGANPAPANQAPSARAAAPKQAQSPKPAPPSTSAIKAAPATTSKTAKSAAGPGSKTSSRAAASSTAKSPKSKSATAAKSNVPRSAATPSIKTVAVRESIVRRDPFAPLLGNQSGGGGGPSPNLPPGKPGLLISSLRIDGVVSAPSGMIAIVSNAQDRVYFLREGDRLYDGQVEHITMDGISFHQTGKDPFGNAVEREVAKRLNS